MKLKIKNKKGFAMIAALLAILILTAVGVLVFTITTQDIRVSMRVVGEKKAFSAAEAGINSLIQNFNPANPAASDTPVNVVVDAATDANTVYSIANTAPSGAGWVSMLGYTLSYGSGATPPMGNNTYNSEVTGRNTRYDSSVQIDLGVGWGPIPSGTQYP
jgi:Tfp pilus assembly protein PilX